MRDELIRLGRLVTGDRLESIELVHYLLDSISQVETGLTTPYYPETHGIHLIDRGA